MGEESEIFFETLHFGTVTVGEGEGVGEVPEWDTDFKTLVSKLDSYFFVKRNIIHKRTKFQERKQSDSETTEECYKSIRALVDHCEYTDIESSGQICCRLDR